MQQLRTHVLMLSVSIATVVGVTLAAVAADPGPDTDQFQAAQLEIEPAPLPPALRPTVESDRVALRPAPETVRDEQRAARARDEAAAAEQAEREARAAREAQEAREREAAEAREREAAAASAPSAPSGSVWDRLAQCESGGNWAHSGGMYEGGLQFHPGTWDAHKPSGYPDAAYQASRAQQIAVAERVLASQGWSAWPSCSRQLGLR